MKPATHIDEAFRWKPQPVLKIAHFGGASQADEVGGGIFSVHAELWTSVMVLDFLAGLRDQLLALG